MTAVIALGVIVVMAVGIVIGVLLTVAICCLMASRVTPDHRQGWD